MRDFLYRCDTVLFMRNPKLDPQTQGELDRAAAHWRQAKDSRQEAAAHIHAARKAGATLREIAAAVGCSVMTVKRLISEEVALEAEIDAWEAAGDAQWAADRQEPALAASEFPPNAPPGAKDVTVDKDGWTHWTEKGEKWSRPPKGHAPLTGKK